MLEAKYLLVLMLFGLIAWIWRSNLAARERAIDVAKRTCRQMGVQLLDQTVAIAGLGLGQGPRGIRLRRRYRFEFTTDGSARFPGRIELIGLLVRSVQLDPPEGLVVSPSRESSADDQEHTGQ
ncbi:DUF3301 domain-containing protein [Natronospira bacteriovora]|uniref:DUF3301 domain-containing protein n=1 Tax=Natronospira bacteriovora TaxID=3069753 RepID=A0ABU0W502_9GAMM|nr:DUF3301 domain-containing protein [Natronospira sp. AB-CW4]MDQ2069099.1 DUF3301 domain-containing protein [Natronospira sp. AB-CW4]